jgi:hypothetical protein
LQPGEPVWLPELGLGIGRVQGEISNVPMQWLAWFDAQNQPYPLPDAVIQELEQSLTKTRLRLKQAQIQVEQAETRAEQAENRAEQERIRAEQERAERLRLLERLRQMGIDLE